MRDVQAIQATTTEQETIPTLVRREEKLVPLLKRYVTSVVTLEALCAKHSVDIENDGTSVVLTLTERSMNLPGFADSIDRLELLVRMGQQQRSAYLADLSTLEGL